VKKGMFLALVVHPLFLLLRLLALKMARGAKMETELCVVPWRWLSRMWSWKAAQAGRERCSARGAKGPFPGGPEPILAEKPHALAAGIFTRHGRVRSVGPDGVSALCRGTGELYTCGWSFEAGWHRSCPSIGRCSHLWAFETVTVRPKDLRRQRVEEAS
jgi:hypothetical protein